MSFLEEIMADLYEGWSIEELEFYIGKLQVALDNKLKEKAESELKELQT